LKLGGGGAGQVKSVSLEAGAMGGKAEHSRRDLVTHAVEKKLPQQTAIIAK